MSTEHDWSNSPDRVYMRCLRCGWLVAGRCDSCDGYAAMHSRDGHCGIMPTRFTMARPCEPIPQRDPK